MPEHLDYKTGVGYKPSYPATNGVQEFCDYSRDEEISERVWPSIHMPRWASRINLEVTDVRVQSLQEISTEDAVKEGVSLLASPFPSLPSCTEVNIRTNFKLLWDSINLKRGYSWDSDPWVWALTFKRLPHLAHGS